MQEIKSKFNIFRQKIHIIVHGTNTVAGRMFDLILLGLILLSVLLVMLETVQGFNQKYHAYLIFFEWVITILFTIEYILRVISINKPFKYIFSFYGIIDLIAVLPLYLAFFFTGISILTIVRSLRLLRLFKILNHPKFSSQSLQLKKAMIASKRKIVVFLYFVLISTIIIGSIMYLVEGKESGFTSIPTSIYWTIVTITTVGGNISPITPLGQFIASLVMILGYGIIAVPTGIITAEITRTNAKKTDSTLKNPCKNCGTEYHRENAKFCYHCGYSLEK